MEKIQRAWWKEAAVYQIYPRSFCDSNGDGIGDLNGILQKLDYIQGLGVDVLWLNPIYDSPNVDNGYDIRDYRAILAEFGTMEDFDRLLEAVHRRGMRLVMDLVVNHTSDQHPWFLASRSDRNGPMRDYYIWKDPKPDGGPPNNWGGCFGGPAWTYDKDTGQYYLHLFTPEQPDLNWENPAVRDAVFDMMDFWFQRGIDGFRMDVISMISKGGYADGPLRADGLYGDYTGQCANGPRVHEYLREMNRRVLSRYDCMTVGENAAVTPELACQYAGFDRGELNMVFHFELMDVDGGETRRWELEHPWKLTDIKGVMTRWQTLLDGRAWNTLFWGNHDQPRPVSRFGDDSTEESRVRSAKMLAVCLYLMQGTPYIYQGEELGMTNTHFTSIDSINDVQTRNAYRERTERLGVSHEDMMGVINYNSREHARTPMHWTAGRNAGFTDGEPWIALNPNYPYINAQSQVDDPDSVYHFYRRLLAVRKGSDTLLYGHYRLLLPDSEEIYAYTRTLNGKEILVVCNFTGKEVRWSLPDGWTHGEILISNYDGAGAGNVLRPFEAFALRRGGQSEA